MVLASELDVWPGEQRQLGIEQLVEHGLAQHHESGAGDAGHGQL
jgi:hypothetical protein